MSDTFDFNSLAEGFKPSVSSPLDTTGEDWKKYAEGFTYQPTEPQISPEVTQRVTARPVGRPPEQAPERPKPVVEETGPVVPGLTRAQETAATGEASLAQQGIQLSPYVTGGYAAPEPSVRTVATEAPMQMSVEATEAAKEFIREEAMPVVGATVGTLLAPTTGGTSFLMATGMAAGAAGLGAFTGEAVEQIAKKEGVLTLAKEEVAPKDAWDILERSAWRGGEEALWSLVPDIVVKAVPTGVAKLIRNKGKKGAGYKVDGTPVDFGRDTLQRIMQKYAEKKELGVTDVILTSDVVQSQVFESAENITVNSIFGGKKARAVRETQAKALQEEITSTIGKYYEPAEGYVKSQGVDSAISKYVEASFSSMNDFGVAGLVNTGFKKAQEAQKSIARTMYRAVGEAMEGTSKAKTTYKEVELGILGPDGKPMVTLEPVEQQITQFPVDLRGVRKIGEERMDMLARTGAKPDAATATLLSMPNTSDFTAVSERLVDMKADSRTLGKSTAEGAAKHKLVLDKAITELEKALENTAKNAEAAGVVGPDGRSVYELKKEADAIWKEQVEDFQNSYVMNIIKNTNPKNGAPEKLGRLFMQNETAARNIMKVLDDAKGNLKGADLDNVLQAENAIKGSIVEDIFMPFDNASGKYMAPDTRPLVTKEKELRRIFGNGAYQELRNLGAAIDQQAKTGLSNYLGFAQRARESGALMSGMKALINGDRGPFSVLLKEGGSTALFLLGAGKLLTDERIIRNLVMTADPEIPLVTRTNIAQNIIHRLYDYQQAVNASMTPEDHERFEAKLEDIKEADRIRTGQY